MNAQSLPAAYASMATNAVQPGTARPLAYAAGLLFAARFALTYVFFQSDPRMGTIANLSLGVALFLLTLLSRANGGSKLGLRRLGWPVARAVAAYLLLCGASLAWTQAESVLVCAAYLAGMTVDCLTVLALVSGETARPAHWIILGYVHGCLLVALLVWSIPVLPDGRIGHEEFLHPNGLGLNFALAALLTQNLPARTPFRGLMLAALVASLFRTLSKTSILAFVLTECLWLLASTRVSRAVRIRLAAGGLLLLAAFAGLFARYLDSYSSNIASAGTLTGRTTIWAVAAQMAMETPWLGRGLYSFRAQIPAFGSFEPWHAHNELLQQFFEFGIVGVAITLWIYSALGRAAWLRRRHAVGTCALMLVCFSAVHGLTDTVNFGLSLPLWLTVLLGLQLVRPAREEAAC